MHLPTIKISLIFCFILSEIIVQNLELTCFWPWYKLTVHWRYEIGHNSLRRHVFLRAKIQVRHISDTFLTTDLASFGNFLANKIHLAGKATASWSDALIGSPLSLKNPPECCHLVVKSLLYKTLICSKFNLKRLFSNS